MTPAAALVCLEARTAKSSTCHSYGMSYASFRLPCNTVLIHPSIHFVVCVLCCLGTTRTSTWHDRDCWADWGKLWFVDRGKPYEAQQVVALLHTTVLEASWKNPAAPAN